MAIGGTGSDIIVKIGADLSGLNSGFKQAESSAGSFENSIKSHSASLSTAGTAMTAGITAPLVAIGAFSVKAAMTVDSAFSTMAKSTGLQGTQLTALQNSWKQVYSSVPVDANTLTSVIDKLNNSLHLQGSAMTEAATSMVDYAKVTGTDAASDTDTFTKAVQGANAGLTAMHQPLMTIPQLTDMMTVGFQKTGVSADQISGAFDKSTASMTKMGMSIPQQIAMLDQLTAAGVPARQLTTIINGIPVAAAKAGESSTAFWSHLVADAKLGGKYTGDETTLLGKQASAFTASAMSGKLSNDQLVASITNSQGATAKAASAMQTLSEKFDVFKQQAILAFAPLGEALIGMASQLLTLIMPLMTMVGNLAAKFGDLPGPLKDVVLVLGLAAAAAGPLLLVASKVMTAFDTMKKTVSDLSTMIGPLVQKLTGITIPGQTATKATGLPSIASSACPDPACFDKVLQKTNTEKAALGDVKSAASDITPAVEDTGSAVEDVGSHAGLLGGIFDMLPGPLQSIAGMIPGISGGLGEAGVAAEGVGAGVAGGAESGGLMAAAVGLIGPALTPVLAILAPIVAIFGVLYATSNTFRGSVGALVSQFQALVGWVMELVGDLTSLNFSKLSTDLVSGITGGLNILKNDIMGLPNMLITSVGESVTTIGGIFDKIGGMLMGAFTSVKNIDWGGMVNGLLTAIDNVLTGLLNFDPTSMINNLINGIGAAFDSLFGGGTGGGGSAGTKASTGLSTGLSTGMAKAGPNILGKLGDVFIKLLTLLPTIFLKVGTALFNALVKVDWGGVWTKMVAASAGAWKTLITFIQKIDWGAIWTWIFNTSKNFWTKLIAIIEGINWGAVWTWLINMSKTAWGTLIKIFENLPWGAAWTFLVNMSKTAWGAVLGFLKTALGGFGAWFSSTVSGIGTFIWTHIVSAVRTFGTWISGLVSGIGSFIWTHITSAVGTFGSWLGGLVSGIGNTIWSRISSAVGQFGSWLGGLVSGVGGKVWSTISSAVGQFGSWLGGLVGNVGGKVWDSIKGAIGGFGDTLKGLITGVNWGGVFGGLGSELTNAVKGAWNNTIGGHHSFLGISFDVPDIATGAIVGAKAGGQIVRVGEGGEPEIVVPWHRVGESWSNLLSTLPRLASGGIIGATPIVGNISPGSSSRPSSSSNVINSGNTTYNNTTVVDSEDLTRKVHSSFRRLEDLHAINTRGGY
jgi:phage-related minor tail protein